MTDENGEQPRDDQGKFVKTEEKPLLPDGIADPPPVNEAMEAAKDDPNAEIIRELFPELAGDWSELKPDVQRNVLIKALAAARASKATERGNSDEALSESSQVASQPSARELPPVNRDAIRKSLVTFYGEDDEADAWMKALVDPLFAYVQGFGKQALDAIDESARTMKTFGQSLSSVTEPNQLRALVPRVPGATEAHIPAARKLLESGDATTMETALKLAVFETQSVRQASANEASEEARRRAAAMAAQGVNGPNVAGGVQDTGLTENLRDLVAEQIEEEALRK